MLLSFGVLIGALIQDVFQSRAAIIIGGAGLIVLAAVLPRLAPWVLAGFGLGVLGIWLGGDAVGVGGEGVVLSAQQVTARGSLISAALHLIGQNPLLGAGFGALLGALSAAACPRGPDGQRRGSQRLSSALAGGRASPVGLFLLGLLGVSFFAGLSFLRQHLSSASGADAALAGRRAGP
ncbi:MAG: hypothetical protein U5R48_02840 [Gammaproteobacteria bacterium]|nr:hypothetical protein [Gammaproteobacteria bacterium]